MIAIVSILGGVAAVDAAPAFQIMINRPIAMCPLIGAIFGMTEVGVMFGVLFELPWLVNMPLGGKHGSDNSLGALAATGLAVIFMRENLNQENIIVIINFLFGMAVAKIGFYAVDFVRQKNLSLVKKAELAIEQGEFSQITKLNLLGALYSFLMGCALTLMALLIGMLFLPIIIKFIHPAFNEPFGIAKLAILGVGFGSVLSLFITNKETEKYFFLPVILGIILYFFIN